jgi:hypothetical protein
MELQFVPQRENRPSHYKERFAHTVSKTNGICYEAQKRHIKTICEQNSYFRNVIVGVMWIARSLNN